MYFGTRTKIIEKQEENDFGWCLQDHKDNLTSLETISQFAKHHNSTLTIMENGEYWLHTEEQMNFIKQWIEKYK